MTPEEYASLDATGLAQAIARGKVSAAEALDCALALADKHNPKLNAIIHRFDDEARARARGKMKGPFAGVPFLLKDILAGHTGTPMRQGSRLMPALPAIHDSTLTTRFLRAGLNPFGRTNVPEFGLLPTTESTLYGPARNPWNPNHSTGGSSGGAAAAVSAGIVPMAHANDGGGSIRIPASACGLVGLKPTRARNPLGPDLGDVMNGLIAEHVVCRSVRDAAALLDCTHGPDLGDPYAAPPPERPFADEVRRKPKPLRIAYATKDMAGKPLHAECVKAVRHAADLCQELGHEAELASPPVDYAPVLGSFMTLWAAGLAQQVDVLTMLTGQKANLDTLEGLTLGLYERGKTIRAADYLNAVTTLQLAARAVARFHQTYDVWLTPTLGAPPLKLGAIDTKEMDIDKAFAPVTDYVPFTALQNATGQPAINLPLYWTKGDLPVGVQFVGRFGDEATLIRLAAQLEKHQPWANRRPKLFG
jgi:amidase